VSYIFSFFDSAIVLEDDLVVSKYFLKYVNKALKFYEKNYNIFSISAFGHPPSLFEIPKKYHYDIYFSYRPSSWGWATWKDRWEKVQWDLSSQKPLFNKRSFRRKFNRGGDDLTDMLLMELNGKIDSWAITWTYAHFKNNALSVCPIVSYVNNTGLDGSGTHCNSSNVIYNDLNLSRDNIELIDKPFVDKGLLRNYRKIYSRKKSVLMYFIHLFNRMLQLLTLKKL